MQVAILGSGSQGNSVVITSGEGAVLIDAGFSCRELERRLALLGVAPSKLVGVVLTHEHDDHARGVDRAVRRWDVPVFATEGTLAGLDLSLEAAELAVAVRSDRPFEVAGFRVEPFLVPHDAREPVGVVVEDDAGGRVGLAADLGYRSRLAWTRLQEVDVLLLETNHDLEMLLKGPYPWSVKQRVAGRHGHLSNRDAAEGLAELASDRLGTVALYHLSRTNNSAAIAAAAVAAELDRLGAATEVVVTDQREVTPWLAVGA